MVGGIVDLSSFSVWHGVAIVAVVIVYVLIASRRRRF